MMRKEKTGADVISRISQTCLTLLPQLALPGRFSSLDIIRLLALSLPLSVACLLLREGYTHRKTNSHTEIFFSLYVI